MLKQINNLFLTFCSISWMILLFVLNNRLIFIFKNNLLNNFAIISIFILVKYLFTFFELHLFLPKYSNDNFNNVIEIENMDSTLLPIYLGYFFISLSVNSLFIFSVIFIIILIFVCFTNTEYYNPMFLTFGYHFYKMKNKKGIIIFIISKKSIKNSLENFNFDNLKRMSNFVFIDIN